MTAGNRCGHQPDAPVWFAEPETHGKRPPVLTTAAARIRDFYAKPHLIPSLRRGRWGLSKRQARSEIREAEVRLIGAMLHYTDVLTLRVMRPAYPGAKTSVGITMERLAEVSGLSLRRAERAMRALVRGGLVAVHAICEKNSDGSYTGRPAIRALNRAVFDLFGLGDELRKERKKRYRKAKQIEEGVTSPKPTSKRQQARNALQVESLKRVLGSPPEPLPPDPA